MGSTTPSSWYSLPFANHGLTWNPDELADDSITGLMDEPNRVLGFTRAGGPIVGNVFPLPLGILLRGLTGAASVSAIGSGFEHYFNPVSGDFGLISTLPPYAIQVDQGESGVNSAYLYKDAFINTLELSAVAGEYVRANWGIIGKDSELVTKAAPATWPSDNNPLRWSSVSLSIGGAGVVRYRDFRLLFDNRVAGQERIDGTSVPRYFF
jgi:hypothetical protein